METNCGRVTFEVDNSQTNFTEEQLTTVSVETVHAAIQAAYSPYCLPTWEHCGVHTDMMKTTIAPRPQNILCINVDIETRHGDDALLGAQHAVKLLEYGMFSLSDWQGSFYSNIKGRLFEDHHDCLTACFAVATTPKMKGSHQLWLCRFCRHFRTRRTPQKDRYGVCEACYRQTTKAGLFYRKWEEMWRDQLAEILQVDPSDQRSLQVAWTVCMRKREVVTLLMERNQYEYGNTRITEKQLALLPTLIGVMLEDKKERTNIWLVPLGWQHYFGHPGVDDEILPLDGATAGATSPTSTIVSEPERAGLDHIGGIDAMGGMTSGVADLAMQQGGNPLSPMSNATAEYDDFGCCFGEMGDDTSSDENTTTNSEGFSFANTFDKEQFEENWNPIAAGTILQCSNVLGGGYPILPQADEPMDLESWVTALQPSDVPDSVRPSPRGPLDDFSFALETQVQTGRQMHYNPATEQDVQELIRQLPVMDGSTATCFQGSIGIKIHVRQSVNPADTVDTQKAIINAGIQQLLAERFVIRPSMILPVIPDIVFRINTPVDISIKDSEQLETACSRCLRRIVGITMTIMYGTKYPASKIACESTSALKFRFHSRTGFKFVQAKLTDAEDMIDDLKSCFDHIFANQQAIRDLFKRVRLSVVCVQPHDDFLLNFGESVSETGSIAEEPSSTSNARKELLARQLARKG